MRLRIGTRGSTLALAQAREVASLLEAEGLETELVPISTSGDRGASAEGSASGTKGLFVAEITEALARGEIDAAVHSAKDLPSEDPEGIEVAAVPKRSLPYDVLVSAVEDVPEAGTVGTSSLRRRAQLRRMRPDLEVVDARGNVDTRLRRLEEGRYDGLVLAAAGLARLGIEPEHARPVPVEDMVPAPGQGALAVQARARSASADALRAIDHRASHEAFEAERRLVALVGGGCMLPLGAYAERREDGIRLLALVIRPDGSDPVWARAVAAEARLAAAQAAEMLVADGADRILEEVRRG